MITWDVASEGIRDENVSRVDPRMAASLMYAIPGLGGGGKGGGRGGGGETDGSSGCGGDHGVGDGSGGDGHGRAGGGGKYRVSREVPSIKGVGGSLSETDGGGGGFGAPGGGGEVRCLSSSTSVLGIVDSIFSFLQLSNRFLIAFGPSLGSKI